MRLCRYHPIGLSLLRAGHYGVRFRGYRTLP